MDAAKFWIGQRMSMPDKPAVELSITAIYRIGKDNFYATTAFDGFLIREDKLKNADPRYEAAIKGEKHHGNNE